MQQNNLQQFALCICQIWAFAKLWSRACSFPRAESVCHRARGILVSVPASDGNFPGSLADLQVAKVAQVSVDLQVLFDVSFQVCLNLPCPMYVPSFCFHRPRVYATDLDGGAPTPVRVRHGPGCWGSRSQRAATGWFPGA